MIAELTIQTNRRQCFSDITRLIDRFVEKSEIGEGLCILYVPHTTAGVTVNERADPDVIRDLAEHLDKMVPPDGDYRHSEGNSNAHIKSTLVGNSVTLFFQNDHLLLGSWGAIFFAEFDGPRHRKIKVQLIPGISKEAPEI